MRRADYINHIQLLQREIMLSEQIADTLEDKQLELDLEKEMNNIKELEQHLETLSKAINYYNERYGEGAHILRMLDLLSKEYETTKLQIKGVKKKFNEDYMEK